MRRTGTIVLAGAAALGWSFLQLPPPATGARTAALPSDFNGDGYGDLAIGVPFEDIGSKVDAGAVNVIYGSRHGLTSVGDQAWSQDRPGVRGVSHRRDHFGTAVVSGDFDRDGYADLAVAVPDDRTAIGGERPGAVNVLYGSRRGLTATGDQRWSRGNLPGISADSRLVGRALASADFDGDGYWDLAIGVGSPPAGGGGAVVMLLGSPDGLVSAGATLLTAAADAPDASRDAFGGVLAAGDLDGDGHADLAVGVPWGPWNDWGPSLPSPVSIIYGSGDGLTGARSEVFTQKSAGMQDGAETGWFGASLAVGDFNADGFGDLAAGVPQEYPASGHDGSDGAVAVLWGSATGLTTTGNVLWFPPRAWVPPSGDEGTSAFGSEIAAGDFDGSGAADLAIGAWCAELADHDCAGVVVALYGTPGGSGFARAERWTQSSSGIPGASESWDHFGRALASADYGRSRRDDLAIGVPGENGRRGRVVVLYGRSTGLSGMHAQGWSQNTRGIAGGSERDDWFGWSLSGSQPGMGR